LFNLLCNAFSDLLALCGFKSSTTSEFSDSSDITNEYDNRTGLELEQEFFHPKQVVLSLSDYNNGLKIFELAFVANLHVLNLKSFKVKCIHRVLVF
jgi:hypothetical protein